MHIAFFTDSYLPYTSGVVRSLVTFRKELESRGHRVFIFAPRYGGEGEEEGVYRFRSLRAPTFKDFALAFPLSPGLPALLKTLGVEIIHVHSPFLMGSLGAVMARRLGLPLVGTYHTLYEEYTHYFPLIPSLVKKLVRFYTIGFYNRCDLVIAPSQGVKNYLRERGLKVPVNSIPTGIELERFKNLNPFWLRERLGLTGEEKIVLHVGRLGKEKNIPFILRSFARVSYLLPQAKLVLVGNGPLRSYLEALARDLAIEKRVIFAGGFAFHEMPQVYAGAQVLAFASQTETQGLVVAEAKAAGIPVVAVRAMGVEEAVVSGEDGFLTPPEEGVFAHKLMELLSNDVLRKRMGHKAQENARAFSAKLMAQKLEYCYNELRKEGKCRCLLK